MPWLAVNSSEGGGPDAVMTSISAWRVARSATILRCRKPSCGATAGSAGVEPLAATPSVSGPISQSALSSVASSNGWRVPKKTASRALATADVSYAITLLT